MDNLLALLEERIRLLVRSQLERLKTREELLQVAVCRIAKDFRLSIGFAGQSFRQVKDESIQLFDERLLRHLNRFVEASLIRVAIIVARICSARLIACSEGSDSIAAIVFLRRRVAGMGQLELTSRFSDRRDVRLAGA
ncbi:hypothetical protein LOC69_20750 [Blastopirellula sp. JC733]|nr:hypothetical protein [Blastopirellula sediminis]